MPKSDIKPLLRKEYPGSFTRDEPRVKAGVGYVIIDSAMVLYSFTDYFSEPYGDHLEHRTRKTGKDLVSFFLNNVNEYFHKSHAVPWSGVDVIFLTHDVAKYVPLAKGAEQAKREKARKPSVDGPVHDYRDDNIEDLIAMDKELPDFKALLSFRELRVNIMKRISQLIRETHCLPHGKYLVLDGEFGHECEPHVLVGRGLEQLPAVYRVPQWKTSQGEADLRVFGIINTLIPEIETHNSLIGYLGAHAVLESEADEEDDALGQKAKRTKETRPKGVLLRVMDTDVVVIDILQCDRRLQDCSDVFKREVYIQNGNIIVTKSTGEFVATDTYKKKKLMHGQERKMEYIDCNRLMAQMAEKMADDREPAADARKRILSSTEGRLQLKSVAMALMLKDNDYTVALPNVSIECIYETYMKYRDVIGPLFTCNRDMASLTENFSKHTEKDDDATSSDFCSLRECPWDFSEPISEAWGYFEEKSKLASPWVLYNYVDRTDIGHVLTREERFRLAIRCLSVVPMKAAYEKLIYFAFFCQYKKSIVKEYNVASPTALTFSVIAEHVRSKTPNSAKMRIPSQDSLNKRFARFYWTFLYWSFDEAYDAIPNEMRMGFERVDAKEPLTKKNIQFSV